MIPMPKTMDEEMFQAANAAMLGGDIVSLE